MQPPRIEYERYSHERTGYRHAYAASHIDSTAILYADRYYRRNHPAGS
jgi:hypothetical protein